MANVVQQIAEPTDWHPGYTQQDRDKTLQVISWLNDNVSRGWTQTALAKKANISKPTVYQVLSGTYISPPTKHLVKMLEVIAREVRREQQRITDTPFVETSVYRMVVAACHRAHLYRGFAVVSAFVGTGKTTAVKQYAANHSNVYLLEAQPGMSASVLISELVDLTGAVVNKTAKYGNGTAAERMRAVIKTLQGSDSLLIIDEAETVTPQTLETVRRIRDIAQIGVVLSGTEKLKPMVKDPRGRFGQISSRVIFWPPVIRHITEADAAALTAAHLPNEEVSPEVQDALWQMCDGSARVLTEALIPGVRDYGLARGHALTPELVFRVGQEILGFSRPARRAS